MMNKQSCENHFNSYKDRADTSNCINELESKLKENNLDFKNIFTIFTYNREELEFSVLTSPSSNIIIKCKKYES